MTRLRRSPALIAVALAALALLAACAEGGGDAEPTAKPPTATAVEATTTPTPGIATEAGEAPAFWRTLDPFDALPAGAGSKVVFRITNGYEEETLRIVAQPKAGGPDIEFEAGKVVPGEGEPPGAYYALNLDLPEPGSWQVAVLAGDDQVIIPVEVVPSEG